MDQLCATQSGFAFYLGKADADLHGTDSSSDLEHVLLFFVQLESTVSHEDQSPELRPIILEVDSILTVLDDGVRP